MTNPTASVAMTAKMTRGYAESFNADRANLVAANASVS